jgi:apolipoprotein N-acyltransferase
VSSRWGARVLAVLAGVLAGLSQPPFSWPVVLILALPLLYGLWHHSLTGARAFWIGWFAGLGYFGFTLHWIVEPFLVQPEIFGWMIPFALTGMAGGMALFWGAGFWIGKRFDAGWAAPFSLTFGWVGMEWLRGNILSGFPWSLLGYAWVETPAMQLASYVGIYGVTLWTVLIGTMLGFLFLLPGLVRKVAVSVAVLALFAGPFLYAMDRLPALEGAEATTTGPQIGLVQPNVAQKDKWQPHLREQHLADLLSKTRELSDQGADVVIWPEAATPYQFDRAPILRTMVSEALKPSGILLAGGIRFEGNDAFNSLIAVDSGGVILDTYDKQHLVPFGEKIPFEPLLSRLGLRAMISLPGGFTTGGARERNMRLAALPPLVPMICYEAIFPAEIMRRAAQADWLVHVTNDAWFGNWVGPYQHLAMARVRAIERGLPVARAANTGISGMIDGYGRMISAIPLNEPGILLDTLPPRAAPTLYARYEDIPFGLGLLLCFGAGLIGRFFRPALPKN